MCFVFLDSVYFFYVFKFYDLEYEYLFVDCDGFINVFIELFKKRKLYIFDDVLFFG